MSILNTLNIYYILLGGIVLIIIYILIKNSNTQDTTISYKLKQFLSENEKKCFRHLIAIYPEYYILPQVSMGALLEPNADKYAPNENKEKGYYYLWGKIKSNRIDFVIMNESLNPIFIVELDDPSHDNKKEEDQLRDLNFTQVGIPTIRIRNIRNTFLSRRDMDEKLKQLT